MERTLLETRSESPRPLGARTQHLHTDSPSRATAEVCRGPSPPRGLLTQGTCSLFHKPVCFQNEQLEGPLCDKKTRKHLYTKKAP